MSCHRHTICSLVLQVSLLALNPLSAETLKFAGTLGNSGGSGESRATFVGKPARALGPVIDDDGAIWERGGSDRLSRYSPDGRLLASFEIPESNGRLDQMTRAGHLLVLNLQSTLYTLPLDAAIESKPQKLDLNPAIKVLSSSSFEGRLVVYSDQTKDLEWLDPGSGERSLITRIDTRIDSIHVTGDGTVHTFGDGEVRAWKDGKALVDFPKGFRGESPQKIGSHWYSHAGHGTINRINANFQPDPGVVLGGASGSFIGFLPESADLDKGCGMAQLHNGSFLVSGMGGVVQLLTWNGDERRMEIARRIGALNAIPGVALDESGNIWTTRGSWRWEDGSEAPLTVGDKEAEISAQPTVLNGKSLCVLKTHYRDTRLCSGVLIDESGWSHLATKTVNDFKLSETTTGSAAINRDGKWSLIVVERGGKAFEFRISDQGQMMSDPAEITLPGLKNCSSLAWLNGQLLAADDGKILAFEPGDEKKWQALGERASFKGEIHISSDGSRLVVSERESGTVHLLADIGSGLAKYSGLQSPTHVAISGDRLVVFEEDRQQLLKLELRDDAKIASPTLRTLPKNPKATHKFTQDDFHPMSRPGGIPFSIALNPGKESWTLSIRTPGEPMIGIANAKDGFILSAKDALRNEGQFNFTLPGGDWSHLRIAASVKRGLERERFGFNDHQPMHAAFAQDPASWQTFDLSAYEEAVSARKKEIRLTFNQALEGKASLVIEDAKTGTRIRNLVSGRTFGAGQHSVIWNGLDEQGRLVAPGTYTWRGITHPGITPNYRMSFADGDEESPLRWGPNHSTLQDATTNGKLVFFAAPVTEGGWALMALDGAGNFVQGYEHQHGFGILHDAIAADDQYLYCAQDGFTWGDPGSRNQSSDWVADWKLTIVRYEISSGKLVEFPGNRRALEIDLMKVGPGSDHKNLDEFNLAGLAVNDGKLYIGSRNHNAVLVYDATTGERIHTIPAKGVRHLASGSKIYAATDSGVLDLSSQQEIIASQDLDIRGITIGQNNEVYLSDHNSHQVHRFSEDGKKLGTIGNPGGPYEGSYDPARMVNPSGLAMGPDGKLWVTEDRWNPKRVLAWDLKTKTVAYEKFGMPHYGGDGSGFDPKNPRRWIGLGCFWDVDIEKSSSRPTHIMSREEGHFKNYHPQSYRFFRDSERTFLCSRGKIALISEVRDDGTIRDIAAVCGTHHFAYGCDWQPPQAYIDAFYAKWPEKKSQEQSGANGERQPWAQRGMGVLWVDRNGDGETQQNEFDFCGDQLMFADGAWGHLQSSLTLEVPVVIDDQVKILAIAPRGFLTNGVPNYPTLDEAIATGTPVSLSPGNKRSGVATVRDRQGRFIFNSDPEMNAYSPEGEHLWTYPNQWSDVHGSHDAPLPEPGVMQGTLAFLGCAPLDDQSDVVFLNGNHGRCFVVSTDGIYLDEAFVDVRVSYVDNEYRLGGEIFGGSFARSETDGNYYVQIGHGPYRIYQLKGLDQIKRIAGTLEITTEQIESAEQQIKQRVAKNQAAKRATLPGIIQWDKGGQFKAQLELSHDATHLHLHYRIEDRSPWINNGRDWTKLFATGDSVDFQFATDPDAEPSRREPVPGDKRLLIAPFEGKAIAVLYEHRQPNEKNNRAIEFTSPWRAEKVDNVRPIEAAVLEAKVEGGSYSIIAKIPLTDLGLSPLSNRGYLADFGVTFGNAAGTDTNLRSYWSNQSTGLVDDIPGEIMLSPNLWGGLQVIEK
ncbi:MAG: hypothetical protein QNL33_14600 [Akkermansiaceae bacterium]|jgi:hypothetical protein